jgi:ABC-type branched-subunit amino acid transport system permease subunit
VFGSASGVLFASVQQSVDATLISLLVVQAFGAAALGAFTNLPLAYVGGLGVGVVQALFSKLVASDPGFQGLDTNVPFIVLFVALLVIPRDRLVELGRPVKARILDRPPRSNRTRAVGLSVVIASSLVLPHLVGARLPLWSNALSQVLLFASLGLLVRTSGQISLGQIGFAAIGAVWFAKALDAGVPWLVAVLIGGLVALPVGAFIAIPAIRLSGVFLALATLGFGVFLAQYVYRKGVLFGDQVNFPTGRPEFLGLDTDVGYYHVLLVAAVVGLGCILLVERSRLGRLLRGVSDSPLALSTLGANVNITKVIVFAVAAFMAGVSGALFAGQFGSINGESFVFFQSVVLLVVLVISGRSTVVAAVVAPLLSVVLPGYIGNADLELLLQVAFGVAAVAVSLLAQRSLPELLTGGRRVAAADDRATSTTQARVDGWALPTPPPLVIDDTRRPLSLRASALPRPTGRTT